jgi:hypothetical protein
MWYTSTNPDPAETVSSVLPGYYFRCPDVTTVDGHIHEMRTLVDPRSNVTEPRRQAARRDIDRLLERRLYLKMIALPDAA